MAWAAATLEGNRAGGVIIAMLIIFSLSRGICSVSAKDVLGKTVSKSRRGTLMGWSASLSGIAVLALGLWMSSIDLGDSSLIVFAGLLIAGAVLWLIAGFIFSSIKEQPGATEGGGNALEVALKQLNLVVSDAPFRRYLIARSLLLSVALAPPFYVLVAQQNSTAGLLGLGALIIANGLATSISSPFWGYMSDSSSRRVMMFASIGAGLLGVFTYVAITMKWSWAVNEIGLAVIFLLLNVMHGGVRLGRKVYLMDMASGENRASYVAVSNTIIGIMMLLGGLIGLVGEWFGAPATLLFLGLLSLAAAIYIARLTEVSEPE
jgi:hypothetical protein